MDSVASMMWSMVFDSIGIGYFVYGKRQKRGIAMLSGIALLGFPHFVSNVFLMITIGIVLMGLPYFIKY